MTNSVLFRLEEFPTRYRHYDHLMSEASAKLPSFPVLKIIHYKHYIKQKSVLVLFPGGFANEVFLEQISNRKSFTNDAKCVIKIKRVVVEILSFFGINDKVIHQETFGTFQINFYTLNKVKKKKT